MPDFCRFSGLGPRCSGATCQPGLRLKVTHVESFAESVSDVGSIPTISTNKNYGDAKVSTGCNKRLMRAGIDAHRDENQTTTATSSVSKKSAKVLTFPVRTEALPMAA